MNGQSSRTAWCADISARTPFSMEFVGQVLTELGEDRASAERIIIACALHAINPLDVIDAMRMGRPMSEMGLKQTDKELLGLD